ncbi:hypothetical protein A3I28_00700 [Candidatus Giovannonibacteria bacterium RIFCSPLOWO2_02_FULL_43_37]|uniref:Uncharacterized protein n=1 Tax=Candidatus Giovannonibacteria bacterium RIFCSPLOWO2_12_FULL_43_26 TaxID=1798363 RepID=A0A1F5XX04_9BACT|nr:MAG: hypothetical protein UW05_C0010G0026 [Candidatus Giovannonibacteria bacterium GW2011_GWC2_43_8]OGF71400.1 MAG: hypothetical protein A3E35_03215 [Candidatus Giovannonibacteria bacterium RIFCSPHIGHO2_12_FULL_44_22]OGF86365.1 MAG: hypothetical protein A3I28_00700 [Candidatus Giovannonibacteria bacterium RIFCSPLOWO2_02_FULL_43_37]OGF92465.1 MAG: hypothetical protein A3H05_03460 [Candidatus Giovannonibacteria bacterium RIFCSPLOWO2_12_FULL_43_26]
MDRLEIQGKIFRLVNGLVEEQGKKWGDLRRGPELRLTIWELADDLIEACEEESLPDKKPEEQLDRGPEFLARIEERGGKW